MICKIYLALLVLISYSSSDVSCTAYCQNYSNLPIELHVDSLRIIYSLWEKSVEPSETNKLEVLFFALFPSYFPRLDSLFGYYPGDSHRGYLYSEVHKHNSLFFNIISVPKCKKYQKYIEISLGGHWTTGSMEFQYSLLKSILKDSILFIKLLNDYSNNEVLSFWYFLYDGPYPENMKDYFLTLYNISQELNPRVADLMKQAYEGLILESKVEDD
jgi:hypothetical protein